MSFDLKNAGAIYQHTITVLFHDMLNDCLEDYVDNVVIKSRIICHYVDDFRKVFTRYKHII